MKIHRGSITTLVAALLVAVTSIGIARASGVPQTKSVAPNGRVTVKFLGIRTADDMARDAGRHASAPTVEFNLPTMPLDEYVAAKNTMRAMAAQEQGKPAEPAAPSLAAAPIISTVNFNAASQCDNGTCALPPDTEGAAGPSQIVQTTNSRVDVWAKSNPSGKCRAVLPDEVQPRSAGRPVILGEPERARPCAMPRALSYEREAFRSPNRRGTDPLSIISRSPTVAATSPACLSGNFDSMRGFQRWGDYSASSMDPRNSTTATNNAWIVNETSGSLGGRSIWTSQITSLQK
jgi:hypothetical protein